VSRFPQRASLLILLLIAVAAGLLAAVADHQVKQLAPVQMGTSGGNVKDISRAFCCSGTLGAVVAKNGQQYILSNNHVLARSDQAAIGEDISQPGLIDSGCRTTNSNLVADFTSAPKLGTANVDAAIAQVRSGMVDPNGNILEIGQPNTSTAIPAVGQAVAKSGRTTGLTCSSIGSVNTDVSVQYQKGCNQGKKFVIAYIDQVVVNSSSFSAGGDSGSLIVTQTGKQPVALLYAGSSSTTIGNPIQDVTSALGVTFVGASNPGNVSCPSSGGGEGGSGPQAAVSPQAMDRALAAKNAHSLPLFQNAAVQGVGVGVSDADASEAVIVIYTIAGVPTGRMPEFLDGVRTKTIVTDRFVAYGWNESAPKACGVQ
jgi:hypothetical protein